MSKNVNGKFVDLCVFFENLNYIAKVFSNSVTPRQYTMAKIINVRIRGKVFLRFNELNRYISNQSHPHAGNRYNEKS